MVSLTFGLLSSLSSQEITTLGNSVREYSVIYCMKPVMCSCKDFSDSNNEVHIIYCQPLGSGALRSLQSCRRGGAAFCQDQLTVRSWRREGRAALGSRVGSRLQKDQTQDTDFRKTSTHRAPLCPLQGAKQMLWQTDCY